jgi:MoxR-like ATPase
VEPGFEPPFQSELEVSADAGLHVALMGPRGVGKTTAVRLYARRRRRTLYQMQGHSDLTIEEMRGSPGIRGGDSTLALGPIALAARDGDFLLFDEVNLCRPGTTAWLNNVLDEAGELTIPETNERIAVSPGFRAFLCFNGGGYSGTRSLNEALLDRCRIIYCDYWPENQEVALLKTKLPRLAEVDVRRMVRVANGIREARRADRLDFDFSMRSLYQWGLDADLRTQDLVESFRAVILPKVGDPTEAGPQHLALLEIVRLVSK